MLRINYAESSFVIRGSLRDLDTQGKKSKTKP